MKGLVAGRLLLVSLALLPVLGFEIYTEYDARQVRQQLMEDEALRLVRLVASEQQRIIDNTEQTLNALGSTPAVQDALPAYCQRLMANLVAQSPQFTCAAVIALDGYTICSPTPVDPGVNASKRACFRLALPGRSLIPRGSPHRSPNAENEERTALSSPRVVICEKDRGQSWSVCGQARYVHEPRLRASWRLRAGRDCGDGPPECDDARRPGGERPPYGEVHSPGASVAAPFLRLLLG